MKSFSIIVKKKINRFNKSIFVPGDKSCSIRYFFLASQAYGLSKAKGILESEDIFSTIKALTKLGVRIVKKNNTWFVWGNGLNSLTNKNNISIDCGNSGTLSRFILSILSTYPQKIKVYGDHSLNKRPMDRIMNPLEKLGAFFQTKKKVKRTLPCYITGSEMPIKIDHEEKIGSGQIKGGLILASLGCPGISTIKEFKNSRNHTEKMLKFAAPRIIKVKKFKNFNLISIKGQKDYKAFDLNVGGDFSSASFFIVLTLLSKNSRLKIKSVNLNPTRLGALKILKKMGGKIALQNIKSKCGERIGDILIKSSNLKSISCPASIVPYAIDEMTLMFFCAAFANGVSLFKGCRELEMKESRRLSLMNKMLNQIGIRTKLIDNDSIKIYGNPNLNLNNKTYRIKTAYDHRLSMVGIILGLTFPGGKIIVEDCNSIATSFPNFLNLMKQLGAKYEIKK